MSTSHFVPRPMTRAFKGNCNGDDGAVPKTRATGGNFDCDHEVVPVPQTADSYRDNGAVPNSTAPMTRTAEDILRELSPTKREHPYNLAWVNFMDFMKMKAPNANISIIHPKEKNYVQYFDYLRNTQGFKASSLCSHL